MAGELLISDPEGLAQKVAVFRREGVAQMHVVSDWDRTLTRARTPDGRDVTSYLAIVYGNYLGPAYRAEMDALYASYRGVEVSVDVPADEKEREMQAWWRSAFELLVRFGFCREMVEDLVARDLLMLREGAETFFSRLAERGIPLLVLSAGIQDVIVGFSRTRSLLTPNVYVIANALIFDAEGRMTGYREPVVHSLNKTVARVRGMGYAGEVTGRRNVMLLGDTLEDAQMDRGLDHDCVIRVGFLNAAVHQQDAYAAVYDVVVCGDGEMGVVNGLLAQICEG